MNELPAIVLNAALLAGLWWLFFFEFPRYRLDLVRQQLFEVRDRLFDDAVRGDIPFDSRAYGMTRNMLNGMIRYAHEISLARTLGIIYIELTADEGVEADRFEKAFDSAIGELSFAGKHAVIRARHLMHRHMLDYVLNRTFPTSMLTLPLRAYQYSRRIKQIARSRYMQRRWSAVDAQYEIIGEQSPSAYAHS